MPIGENLRELRLQSGMTQEQVAEKLGVTRQALSSYESNRTRPDIDMLERLSTVYGIGIEDIVYGQARTLKATKRVKVAAVIVFIVLIILTMLSSSLLWAAHYFFPITDGQQLTQDGMAALEPRFRLTDAWETLDGLILTLAFIGFAIVFILCIIDTCRISQKRRAVYAALLAVGLFIAPLPFAFSDPVFTPVNYYFTPMFVVGRLILFFVIQLIVEAVRNRTKKSK